MILLGVTHFWFDPFTPAELERVGPSRAEDKEKAIAQYPPAYQERARKECDFRPESCERCRLLNWERWLGQPLRWYLELRLRPNSDFLAWKKEAVDVYPLFHQHLVHERHVVGLLSPPSSEVDPIAIPSAISTATPKAEPDCNSGRRCQEIAVSQTGAASLIRGPVPASAEEEVKVKKLPMMPIRDMVIFPHMMVPPLPVGRESSLRALEEALRADKKIFLVTQHDASVEKPTPDQISRVGTVVNIVQARKDPDGNVTVRVEGIERGKILQVTETERFMQVTVSVPGYASESGPEIETAKQQVKSLFEQYRKLRGWEPINWIPALRTEEDPDKLTDTIAGQLPFSVEEKQELLEIFDPADRLNRIGALLALEIEKLNQHPQG